MARAQWPLLTFSIAVASRSMLYHSEDKNSFATLLVKGFFVCFVVVGLF